MERSDAKSVLKQWEHENEQKVLDYFKDHDWLPADIKKVRDYQREYRLTKLAITSTEIFGLNVHGNIHITGRGNLGIGDNFI